MDFSGARSGVRSRILALPPSRPPAAVLSCQALSVAGLIVLALSTQFRAHPGHDALFDSWLYNGLTFLCAGIVASRGWRVVTERAAWWSLSIGMGLSSIGDVVYSALVSGTHEQVPSIADPFYLAFYPCAYVSLVLLLKAKSERFTASAWLDGATCALALSAVAAAVAFGPISADTGGSAPAVVTGLAYPVCDLLLLSLAVAMLTLLGWRTEARLILLAAGFVLFGVADIVYLFQAARGTYVEGTWVDLLWPASSLLVAWASWRPTRRLARARVDGGLTFTAPLVCTLLAVGVLVLDAGHSLPGLAVALAAATMVAALVRLAWTVREVSALANSRTIALTDELTGLGNRRALLSALRDLPGGSDSGAGLLLIDLDHFKMINDSLGHQVGDELLRQLARRLERHTVTGDLLTRVGGDEFAVLLTAGADLATARAAAEELVATLHEPFALDDITLHGEVSVGIALCPKDCADPMELLQRADVAMSMAKGARDHVASYRPQDDPHSRARLQTVEALRAALVCGELTVYYQPQMTLATGTADSVEALVRWEHPVQGLLSPDAFLPLAEQNGLMRPLTLAVLTQALAQVREWWDEGLALSVAVNLSATNLLDVDLAAEIGRLLARHRLPPHALTLEITETVLMVDPVRAKAVLRALRALGVGLSMDDYGTGYSSLAYLHDLAVDELKLDRTFITNLVSDTRSAAIVCSTIELAHSLGMRVVAEGVEDAATLEALIGYGCDTTQGYYHSRPLPAVSLGDWLAERAPSGVDAPGSAPGQNVATVAAVNVPSASRWICHTRTSFPSPPAFS